LIGGRKIGEVTPCLLFTKSPDLGQFFGPLPSQYAGELLEIFRPWGPVCPTYTRCAPSIRAHADGGARDGASWVARGTNVVFDGMRLRTVLTCRSGVQPPGGGLGRHPPPPVSILHGLVDGQVWIGCSWICSLQITIASEFD
jgi:hypothetical protein